MSSASSQAVPPNESRPALRIFSTVSLGSHIALVLLLAGGMVLPSLSAAPAQVPAASGQDLKVDTHYGNSPYAMMASTDYNNVTVFDNVKVGDASCNGTVNQSTGYLTINGALILGHRGFGWYYAVPSPIAVYNQSGGYILTGSVEIGFETAGLFTQTGGFHTITGDGPLLLGGWGHYDSEPFDDHIGTGTYALNGGTLFAPGVAAGFDPIYGAGTSIFRFNGGTLEASTNNSAFMQGLTTVSIQANGAWIVSAGFNITIAQPLLHDSALGNVPDGGLVTGGSGTLTLSGANTYTGQTQIVEGQIKLTASGTLGATPQVGIYGDGTLDVTAFGDSGFNIPKSGYIANDGTLIGNVAGAGNLRNSGTIIGNVNVSGNLTNTGTIIGNVSVGGELDCYGDVTGQPCSFNGNVVITGSGSMRASGHTIITGGLTNQGVISFSEDTLEVQGDLYNLGVIDISSGTLKCKGGITNRSAITIHKGALLDASESVGFYNGGLLDYMTGSALLPAYFYSGPDSQVLTPALVKVKSVSKSGNTFTVKIDGYYHHTYQLQRSTTPKGSGFTNLGTSQIGSGTALTFTDTAAPSGATFYRVQVDP